MAESAGCGGAGLEGAGGPGGGGADEGAGSAWEGVWGGFGDIEGEEAAALGGGMNVEGG